MFQLFPEDADISPSKRVKFGIDPTFPRLHLGHLVPLRLVKKMMDEGHEVTIVLGTFTAQMGDPSGRDTTRPILDAKEVEKNAEEILKQVTKILGNNILAFRGAEVGWLPLDNKPHDTPQWLLFLNGLVLDNMTLPKFFKIASQFSVANMTNRNAFQKRIENNHPIALHELMVPICQGWDSVCVKSQIEIGGQDQLFNFQVARQLQEWQGQKPQANIMLPIIRGTDGRKMSKSLGNTIYLDENPKEMFGQIMSIPDDVMDEWIPVLTSDPHIAKIEHPMERKLHLATDIVEQLHGTMEAGQQFVFFKQTFQQKITPTDIPEVAPDKLVNVVAAIHNCSKTNARQLIASGGVRVNDEKNQDPNFQVTVGQVIQVGKRFWGKVCSRESN